MSKTKKIDPSLHQIIIQQYLSGMSMVTVAEQYGVNHTAIDYILRKYGIQKRSNKVNSKKYDVNENFFSIIDTEEKAYWLGFIYADGYISLNTDGRYSFGLSLAQCDRGHLEKLKASLSSTHKIYDYQNDSGYATTPYSRLLIWNNKLTADLISHGVVEHKTSVLKPPDLEDKLVAHFIRGYIDGDGSISISKDQYKLRILGTVEILDYIKAYIETNTSCKIRKYYKRHKEDVVESIDIGGNQQTAKVLQLFYGNASIYLDRKYERYNSLCSKIVEPSGNARC